MFVNENDFNRLFDNMFKFVFLFVESFSVNQRISGEVLYGVGAYQAT